ncbi:hypothetical protein Noda2021_01790 [Candidatus Dependentiae bacterium Noda2021]|nr:hypothetical protein Noda2021_01790 [Candidatus Dependentiae bacterium Noda2021]
MNQSYAVKKVAMLLLLQPDLEKAVTFYQSLGLKLVFHLKDRWAEFMLGSIQIGLCPSTQDLPERHTGIVFEVDNVRDMFNALQHEITFMAAPQEAVHGIMASIKDPGNNIIDIYQPTPEKVRDLVEQQKAAETCCKTDANVEKQVSETCCKSQKNNVENCL